MPFQGDARIYVGSDLIWTPGGGGADPEDLFPGPPRSDGVNSSGASNRSLITATASGTPHTFGSWVEIDASLSADSRLTIITNASTAASGADSSTILQVGIGGSGAETAWASFLVGYQLGSIWYPIPGTIPAGTRVAVRCQSATASKAIAMVPVFTAPKSVEFAAPLPIGVNTATSSGVALTQPGGNNTKSAWTQITASTASDIKALMVTLQGDSNMAAADILVDIGVGGSGSEVVVFGDLYYSAQSTEQLQPRGPLTMSCDIPAGSRIAARYQRSAGADDYSLALLGGVPA